jgi:isocitrate/isopropylmalate dehydrogenase
VKDDVLVDAHRREACHGIEPKIARTQRARPSVYVLSANINRRHLTKRERAMAFAKLYHAAERGEPRQALPKRKGSLGYLNTMTDPLASRRCN